MKCYICGREVPQEEHTRVQDFMDHMTEEMQIKISDALNLVHCEYKEDCFDEHGAVVICESHPKRFSIYRAYQKLREEKIEVTPVSHPVTGEKFFKVHPEKANYWTYKTAEELIRYALGNVEPDL